MSTATTKPNRPPVLRRPRLRRVARGLALALPMSGLLHLLTMLVFAVFATRGGCVAVFGGSGGQDGENGVQGSGGRDVDITVEGPRTGEIGPMTPGQSEPPSPATPAPEPPRPTPDAPRPTPRPSPRVLAAQHSETEHHQAREQEHPSDQVAQPSEQPEQQPAPQAAREGNPTPQAHGGGTGSAVTNGGLRPGSVGQQRALLPRAVRCGDPVAGVWRAHKYDPLYGDWFRVTLRIEREPNNQLRGVIVARMWDGGPMDLRPPLCGPDGFDFTVEERAHGTQRGWYVEFGANSYVLREMHCNTAMRMFGYNPDHFSGTIDPDIQEFQSVNNDGGRAVNDPMVFRRIRCLATDEETDPSEAAPASEPGEGTTPPPPPSSSPSGGTNGAPAGSPQPAAPPRPRSPWNALPFRPGGAP